MGNGQISYIFCVFYYKRVSTNGPSLNDVIKTNNKVGIFVMQTLASCYDIIGYYIFGILGHNSAL